MDVAAEAVKRLGAGYHLLIAGPPKDATAVAQVQHLAASTGNISVLGRELSDQEFADVHAAADAVLLPYRKITGSSALLAAVGFGRGVIASDLPYFREYAKLEPEFIELARPGDAADLAATIERYFATGAERHHVASERHSAASAWEAVTAPLAELLH
jgi:glycosyltransferase involved in cell wall biosynthesis